MIKKAELKRRAFHVAKEVDRLFTLTDEELSKEYNKGESAGVIFSGTRDEFLRFLIKGMVIDNFDPDLNP